MWELTPGGGQGFLTFDGNLRINQKVTYGRIQQHLQEKYNCKLSYGTVVQLCVARNKRRRSAANYKGVAHVTTHRARKGFCLKYNPDKYWSSALYRGFNTQMGQILPILIEMMLVATD